MATEKLRIDLEVKADNAMKSLKDYRTELKQVNEAMSEAARAGDKAKFEQLSRQYGQLKNDARAFGDALKYADPSALLAGVTRLGQGMAGAFSGISAGMKLVIGDNEQLNAVMGKTAAAIQLVQGLEQVRQLTESKGVIMGLKLQAQRIALYIKESLTIKAVEGQAKAATIAQRIWNLTVAANPIMLLVAGVAALAGGVYILAKRFNQTESAVEIFVKNARANLKSLQKSTEEYARVVKSFNDKIKEFNERNLSDGERAKREFLAAAAQQRLVIEGTLEQLKVKRELIKAEIEQGRAQYEWMQWIMPDKAAIMKKGIMDLTESFLKTHEAVKQGEAGLQTWNASIEANAEKIKNDLDEIAKIKDKENKKDKTAIVDKTEDLKKYYEDWRRMVNEQAAFMDKYREEQRLKDERDKDFAKQLEIDSIQDANEKKIAELNYYYEKRLEGVEVGSAEEAFINQKWIDAMVEAEEAAALKKLALQEELKDNVIKVMSSLAGVLGEQTRKGAIMARVAAGFQISMDTAKAISSAVASGAAVGLTPIEKSIAILGNIATVMINMKQAKQVFSEPLPLKDGGMVYGPGTGKSDSIPARLSNGEAVMNATSMSRPKYRAIASAINVAGGGKAFSKDDINLIDYELLASKINDKKVYVVESEVTEKQKKVSVIEQRTKLG